MLFNISYAGRKRGFTLIELLVVIAIIALLMSIILPSLQAVKELASGVVCTNNQRSLVTGWILYAGDYDNMMVGGSTYKSGHSKPTPYRWVEPPLYQPVYGSTRVNNTADLSQETRKNGIRAGKLFNYLGDVDVYHCPGDKTFRNPEPYAVFRSYAITGLMNGEDFNDNARAGNNEFNPINPNTGYRTLNFNGGSKVLKVALKTTEVRSPGTKFVFMEEDVVESKSSTGQQTYNMGGWVLLDTGYSWWDFPAGYHNNGGTFSYADGHADRRKWQDKDTINLIKEGRPDPDEANNEDLLWLARGYIPIP